MGRAGAGASDSLYQSADRQYDRPYRIACACAHSLLPRVRSGMQSLTGQDWGKDSGFGLPLRTLRSADISLRRSLVGDDLQPAGQRKIQCSRTRAGEK